METPKSNHNNDVGGTEFKIFAAKRVIATTFFAVAVLWVLGAVLGFFEKPVDVLVARHNDTHLPTTEAAPKPGTQPLHEQPQTTTHEPAKGKIDYKEGTVGRIMSTDFIAMGKDTPAGDVVRALKKEHRDIKPSLHVYVVDPHDRLVGKVSMKQLLFANAKTPLRDFMSGHVNSVTADTTQEKAATLTAREEIKALPVVNSRKQLVGIIRAEDVVTLAKKEPAVPVHKKPAVKEPVHPAEPHDVEIAEAEKHLPKGIAFIEAVMKPLSYELQKRFWGWRPNDILNFTDNVNHFQLGVLEVTRRTAVILTERISRTGSTAAFDKNLERAMNWFMIKSDRYWFPSPESKYSAGLKELEVYKEKLKKGEVNFYTRTDNLIPLLKAYENLLGSCDENLIKDMEDDGTPVNLFKADNYFFYAKGVASAMLTILEAVEEDFHTIVESRRGLEVLHQAIQSCHHAVEINPLIITNSSLNGMLANHRANLAARISHARFYLGVLIKTLST